MTPEVKEILMFFFVCFSHWIRKQQLHKKKEISYFASRLISHRFKPFNYCLNVVLWLDKGDFPENVQAVCLCHNK